MLMTLLKVHTSRGSDNETAILPRKDDWTGGFAIVNFDPIAIRSLLAQIEQGV